MRYLFFILSSVTGIIAGNTVKDAPAAPILQRGPAQNNTPNCVDPKRFITVSTLTGPIIGHVAPNTSCVVEYLGIPYAKPPVGQLRFAPPVPLHHRKIAYVASNFGYDCPLTPSSPVDYPGYTPQAPRIIRYYTSGAGNPQSEDCLTLNIWSKSTPKSVAKKKPVIVFFYGGRFTTGNTNTPMYNGKHLADAEDVIVVTVNYRINIFGFPGAPGTLPNLGLRDQRAAVEWLRQNIANFGGDINRIILTGQSAGGVAVDYWAYTYKNSPIAAGLIMSSGNSWSFPVISKETATNNWNAVVNALGCNSTDTEQTLTCMRSQPWTAIKDAAATIRPRPSSSVLRSVPPFYPTPDGEIVFANYTSLTERCEFARLPILIGSNANEAGFYRISLYGNTGTQPTQEQVNSFHLESFTCPAAYQASARRGCGVPAWVYRYNADWPNTRLYEGSGAYHGVDLHMIFGASEDTSGLPTTREQRELTKLMQRAWATFAADPWEGLRREFRWPKWEGRGETNVVIELGKGNQPRVEYGGGDQYGVSCENVTLGALGTSA